ncbi:MAG: maleylacetoacetate isomerase [Gammaproteobacteria bacterium]|nr:maleylacetoacetate isomerase [Gammaproteobacteria bacterium]
MKLYDYFRSSACFRVRIALNVKALSYEKISIHLVNHGGEQRSPEYQAINPQALVPTLQDDDKTLTQSLAIIEYLNDQYPTPPLLPQDAYTKARVRAFALAIAADVHPLNNLRVLKYLTDDLKISEELKNQWYQHWIAKGLSALEAQLNDVTHKTFCFGESPSIADIFLIPQLYNAERFKCDLTPYPRLMRIYTHCKTLPEFMNAWPIEDMRNTIK